MAPRARLPLKRFVRGKAAPRLAPRFGAMHISAMVSPRTSFQAGHLRKFLVVVDETPECDRALVYAAKRAERTGGMLTMLFVIRPEEFQHWLGVEDIMRAEARAEAEATLARSLDRARSIAPRVKPETVVRELGSDGSQVRSCTLPGRSTYGGPAFLRSGSWTVLSRNGAGDFDTVHQFELPKADIAGSGWINVRGSLSGNGRPQ